MESIFVPLKDEPKRVSSPTISRKKYSDAERESKVTSFSETIGFVWLLQPEVPLTSPDSTPDLTSVIFSQEFSTLEKEKKLQFIQTHLKIDKDYIRHTERSTVGQSKNPNWFIQRKHRLTASNFGLILKALARKQCTTSKDPFPPSFWDKLLNRYNLDGVKAIVWGKQNEATAIQAFCEKTGLEVRESGLWVHPSGVLGASPDGLITTEKAILEVKCPFTHRNKSIQFLAENDKKFILSIDCSSLANVDSTSQDDIDEPEYILDTEHPYYHQIQGQLYLSNADFCYFVIWMPADLYICKIGKDPQWATNIDKLLEFYLDTYIPHLHNRVN